MRNRSEFSTFDVMKLLDIKRERLREWMVQGFVKPAVSASGAGSKAEFGLLDLYKIAIFKKLVDAGMNRRVAATWISTNPAVNDLKQAKELNFILLIVDKGGGGSWISYFEPPWMLFEDRQAHEWEMGLLINFKRVRTEIMERLKGR